MSVSWVQDDCILAEQITHELQSYLSGERASRRTEPSPGVLGAEGHAGLGQEKLHGAGTATSPA